MYCTYLQKGKHPLGLPEAKAMENLKMQFSRSWWSADIPRKLSARIRLYRRHHLADSFSLIAYYRVSLSNTIIPITALVAAAIPPLS